MYTEEHRGIVTLLRVPLLKKTESLLEERR
jgi:hypothetical protein